MEVQSHDCDGGLCFCHGNCLRKFLDNMNIQIFEVRAVVLTNTIKKCASYPRSVSASRGQWNLVRGSVTVDAGIAVKPGFIVQNQWNLDYFVNLRFTAQTKVDTWFHLTDCANVSIFFNYHVLSLVYPC